ncbi:ubiquinol-cytochrome-c reductase complex assembly factor 1 isoform X2 [Harpegnathos saltator]|uniref:ubiquinol-cytochrome-c reductase complex assembly factor 1 isoform X2 n=1 Tax=Harpegnathos saltator TaxID=610380 RepID=UPI000948B945|nr:ubiquinol-cytochrome-c reductase complex assembly factor 1 isoform X2 [Harpegnathos saltator]
MQLLAFTVWQKLDGQHLSYVCTPNTFVSTLYYEMFLMLNTMLSSMQRTLQTHGIFNTPRLLPIISTKQLLNFKNIHMTSAHYNNSPPAAAPVVSNVKQMGYIKKMLKKIGFLDLQKYRNMVIACFTYEHMLRQVDYNFFYEHFNMPDTLYSWFLVTELHVWMLMVRYMAEKKNGQFMRNEIVTAMWDDTKARTEKLGTISSNIKNKQIKEISDQFNAAIIGYDEGILSDDKVLAGALWRRFFCLECNNPEHIELLLTYVRIQVSLLDNIPSQDFFRLQLYGL